MSEKLKRLNDVLEYAKLHGFPRAVMACWDVDGNALPRLEYEAEDSGSGAISQVGIGIYLMEDVYILAGETCCTFDTKAAAIEGG